MNTGSKKLQLKTHWAKVLDVHTDWLISKGYTEKLLDSTEQQGQFVERLRSSIIEAVTSTVMTYRLEQFSIELAGLFEKKDTVKFMFNYGLDPASQRLTLSSMKATLADTSIEYPIFRNTERELPPADLVYNQLILYSKQMLLQQMKTYVNNNYGKKNGRIKK